MRHISEYRSPALLRGLVDRIREITDREWRIMEVCGGQTNTIVRYGIDQLLAPKITLIHGPGCPVCVTSTSFLDIAQDLAARPDTILCSFGDMLRVPGTLGNLLETKSAGGNIRILYSPLDALTLAKRHPEKQIIFFAIGFETTAPLTALAILQAHLSGTRNFSILCAHVAIPPAIDSLLQTATTGIDALLAPGHVCTITGTASYRRLAAQYNVPIVVTGFEPADILQGVCEAVMMLRESRSEVSIQYTRAVTPQGNTVAQGLIERVFVPVDRHWRGLGIIAGSGLCIRDSYASYDAARRFNLTMPSEVSSPDHCARVLQGNLTPTDCPHFRRECAPDRPLGAPMVSSEGACAAYVRHGRSEASLRRDISSHKHD